MTVNVLLTTGKWFEVADATDAMPGKEGCLIAGNRRDIHEVPDGVWRWQIGNSDAVMVSGRVFGPGSWVTWDVED